MLAKGLSSFEVGGWRFEVIDVIFSWQYFLLGKALIEGERIVTILHYNLILYATEALLLNI